MDESRAIPTIASIPVKNEFDIVDVGKSILQILGADVPGLKHWVAVWDKHDALELRRRVERFWQAFVIEAHHSDARFGHLARDVTSLQEQLDILARTVSNVRSEFSENKQALYARVAVNALLLVDGRITHDERLSAIDALDRLTDTDMQVLHRFKEGKTFQIRHLLASASKEEDELSRLIVSIRKLEARGLINRTSGKDAIKSSAVMGSEDHWANQWKYSYYELLPFGSKVIRLIEGK
jgi:hypothetical protein